MVGRYHHDDKAPSSTLRRGDKQNQKLIIPSRRAKIPENKHF